jgi:hypothetical protein
MEEFEQPQLDKEVEEAYKKRGFWDRKLASSILELEALKSVMSKYKDDQLEMRRRIKKVRKASKGVLHTIKVLDIPQEDLTEQIQSVTLDDVNDDSQES